MTLTNHWSHVEGSPCKSANTIIATLVETVAKGGNLLLGVGPTGKGTIDDEVVARLHQIGAWLRVNGEAIYGTRPIPVFMMEILGLLPLKMGRPVMLFICCRKMGSCLKPLNGQVICQKVK